MAPPLVLIVDDEKAICDSLAAFLEDEGMRTAVAHSGEEALRRVTDGLAVDVCVMDLRLPGIDGAQAIRAIHERCPGVRFIVHTGSASDKVVAEVARTGLGDLPVLSKPVKDMGRFAQTIQALWTGR
jgi:CheY-like chemotaxis protein